MKYNIHTTGAEIHTPVAGVGAEDAQPDAQDDRRNVISMKTLLLRS